MSTKKLKSQIIEIGQLLWEKDLASGLNGNISARVDEKALLLTGHGTCLGRLSSDDMLLIDLEGNLKEKGKVSTENLIHTSIYKEFPEAKFVVHTHTTYTNAYFLKNATLSPDIFEAKVYLGNVEGVEQTTPAVTDVAPVLAALKKNNIMALRNHGVIAIGETLFDCFCLIQALEDAVKVDAISRLYDVGAGLKPVPAVVGKSAQNSREKYKLFSQEQIDEIVKVVNADEKLKALGEQTNMTMDLAVKLNETGQTYSFRFNKGNISEVGHDENVEFLITAPENVWRAVFNQEIDPFVATTQKKMNLRGDFAKISKWYTPCSRLFELWQQVPVE